MTSILDSRFDRRKDLLSEFFHSHRDVNNPPSISVDDDNAFRTMTKLFYSLKDLLEKEMVHWWDAETLSHYSKAGLVPRGLRVLNQCNFLDVDLQQLWEKSALSCSREWMSLIIVQRERALATIKEELQSLNLQICKYSNLPEFAEWDSKINMKIIEFEKMVVAKKQNKLHRDKGDFQSGKVFSWKKQTNNNTNFFKKRKINMTSSNGWIGGERRQQAKNIGSRIHVSSPRSRTYNYHTYKSNWGPRHPHIYMSPSNSRRPTSGHNRANYTTRSPYANTINNLKISNGRYETTHTGISRSEGVKRMEPSYKSAVLPRTKGKSSRLTELWSGESRSHSPSRRNRFLSIAGIDDLTIDTDQSWAATAENLEQLDRSCMLNTSIPVDGDYKQQDIGQHEPFLELAQASNAKKKRNTSDEGDVERVVRSKKRDKKSI